MTLEQRPKETRRISAPAPTTKSYSRWREQQRQSPEAGQCLECWRNSKEARVAGEEGQRGRRNMGLGRSFVDNGGFGGHSEDFGFGSQ